MKVAIAGGHGKIARRLTRLLARQGDEVVSLIRNPDHAGDVTDDGGQAAVVDLENDDPEKVAGAVGDSDAVVFAAGAGPGSGAARKETMDYGGAVKLIDAANQQGTGHYVMISSMGADPDASEGQMAPYSRAKGKAEEALRSSGLDHTIVRPGALTDDPGTGRVRAGESVGRGSIARDDVALVLLEVLNRAAPKGMTFELVEGDDDVSEALDKLQGTAHAAESRSDRPHPGA
jgi:uncharacterized protein YbjT (DUF2867 family)